MEGDKGELDNIGIEFKVQGDLKLFSSEDLEVFSDLQNIKPYFELPDNYNHGFSMLKPELEDAIKAGVKFNAIALLGYNARDFEFKFNRFLNRNIPIGVFDHKYGVVIYYPTDNKSYVISKLDELVKSDGDYYFPNESSIRDINYLVEEINATGPNRIKKLNAIKNSLPTKISDLLGYVVKVDFKNPMIINKEYVITLLEYDEYTKKLRITLHTFVDDNNVLDKCYSLPQLRFELYNYSKEDLLTCRVININKNAQLRDVYKGLLNKSDASSFSFRLTKKFYPELVELVLKHAMKFIKDDKVFEDETTNVNRALLNKFSNMNKKYELEFYSNDNKELSDLTGKIYSLLDSIQGFKKVIYPRVGNTSISSFDKYEAVNIINDLIKINKSYKDYRSNLAKTELSKIKQRFESDIIEFKNYIKFYNGISPIFNTGLIKVLNNFDEVKSIYLLNEPNTISIRIDQKDISTIDDKFKVIGYDDLFSSREFDGKYYNLRIKQLK